MEKVISLQTPEGGVDGFFYSPEQSSERRGVVYLTDIRGIRPEFRAWAARLAEKGFAVLLPNIFYRIARPPIFDFEFRADDPRTRPRIDQLQASLPPDAIERDGKYFLDALRTQFGVTGPIGVVGHCLSGAFALRMAAACPSDVAAAVSLHGGKLFTAEEGSPHRVLSRVRGRLYFGHADADAMMPVEAITGLEASLAQWGGEWKSELYQGARHGWTMAGSPAYDPVASERAFQTVVDFLRGSTSHIH